MFIPPLLQGRVSRPSRDGRGLWLGPLLFASLTVLPGSRGGMIKNEI
jgi:hypothetical protein